MSKRQSVGDAIDRPSRRPLKIYATDPMAGRTLGNRIRIEVDNEPLRAGPRGARVEVIDFDGTSKCFYPPVDLDDPNLLMQGGLDPTESDPRFHQQMVYAVAMRTLENFDRALGRTIHLGSRSRSNKYPRLRLLPHAFNGANAFYSRKLNAILFGYFRADSDRPGLNLPSQTVFTCLSHDIIVHEITHAIVDRLKRYFLEPSNVDVLAFHEGFSDIVALLQRFSYPELLRDQIQRNQANLRERSLLVELARQFGHARGGEGPLRSALADAGAKIDGSITEPHARGSFLVAAVFDAFFSVYERRIRDLIRIATGGTGKLPSGDLHPDLVNRVAGEAARAAQYLLNMCIRAFDYLPPVDITFGDYLRALVTADVDLSPEDEHGQRAAMIEGFRLRGIYPSNVFSLAEESLRWAAAPRSVPPLNWNTIEMLRELVTAASMISREAVSWSSAEEVERRFEEYSKYGVQDDEAESDVTEEMARELGNYARSNAAALLLNPELRIAVHGFHPVFRVAPNGKLLIELIAQFVQTDRTKKDEFGGIPLRGGTTVVASAEGRVRYIIAKPLPYSTLPQPELAAAIAREKRQKEHVELCDLNDPSTPFMDQHDFRRRMKQRMNLASLHRGLHA